MQNIYVALQNIKHSLLDKGWGATISLVSLFLTVFFSYC